MGFKFTQFVAALITAISLGAVAQTTSLSGANLNGWTSVIGDGVYVAPGESALTDRDIQNDHYDDATVMKANVDRKRAMVHNISFLRSQDANALRATHRAGYSFRLLALPDENDPDMAGQTVEGGLFVWDGAETQLDYGAAFQWIVNPKSPGYGKVFAWYATPDGVREWRAVGTLKPDTAWHRVEVVVSPSSGTATLSIDNGSIFVPDALARERKPGFGSDVTSRLQVEIISADPRPGDVARKYHAVAVANWSWSTRD